MSEQTKISWKDSTCNFWSGCTKVSAGCANCYAEVQSNRLLKRNTNCELLEPTRWGKGQPRKLHESAFALARRLNRKPWVCECGHSTTQWPPNADTHCPKCRAQMHRRRIFSLSMGDWLDPEVPIEWLARMMDTIRVCDQVEWILCSKRPENWRERIDHCGMLAAANGRFDLSDWISRWLNGHAPKHVTILASVEDQEQADKRIPHLLAIPAARRGLILEPLIGPVEVFKFIKTAEGNLSSLPPGGTGIAWERTGANSFASRMIDWLIIGGESGPKARPCNVEWIRSLIAQGKAAGVPVYVKQLGAFHIEEQGSQRRRILHDDPKGGDPSEWPEDLRVREFPAGA